MAYTRIVSGIIVGSRRGYRRQAKPIFSTNRYRVTEERTSYPNGSRHVDTSVWHEDRTSVFMGTETVETSFATVELPGGNTIELDTRHRTMQRGEPVHVAVHHILGREFVDLFDDKRASYATEHYVRFPDPDKSLPLILGVMTVAALNWYGRDAWFSVSTGAYVGIGVHVLLHLRRAYGEQRIRLMRAMTERKLKKAVLRAHR